MTAEQWKKIWESKRAKIEQLENELEEHDMAKDSVEMPNISELRPMTAKDVVDGKVVYGSSTDDEGGVDYFHVIEEVMRPSDPYKAYCADDGCRYGLEGSFVRK